MRKQTLISARWKQTIQLEISEPTQPKLRGSQPGAVRALKGKQHVILNAPTGWGKSLVIVTLLLYKLLRDPNLRGIIVVPQTVIASGFLQDWKLKIPGIRKLVDWVVQHNLCHEQSNQTVDTLIEFLRGRHFRLGDRILLCTHATLAQCYRKLKSQRRLSLIRNVVLWIDEAHHIMNAQVEGRKDTVSNSIGALVKYCMKYNNHIGLATATFMRGDMRHILSDEMGKAFTRFDVPYDVYFETMQPIESFEFNVVCGGKLKALRSVLKDVKPTIIYLAKRQSLHGQECKYKEVKQIKRLLPRLKVVDLVTEKGRDQQKTQLQDCDAIIALDTCKEGFDWPKAERIIILGERHSVPEMIQMIGRLFRRSKGKTHAEVHQILPVGNAKAFKTQRNSILTVVFAAMLLEDVFLPIECKGKKKTFGHYLPSTDAWQALMRDFIVAIQYGYEESLKMASSILKKHGITDLSVWEKLWRRAAIVTRKQQGLRLDVPFEILKKTDITDGLLKLASGLCGAMTFTELRQAIGRGCKTPEEWVLIAEKLAAEHDGMLPNQKWLDNHGMRGLCNSLRKHPNLFNHLEQKILHGRSPEDWVCIAEKLAADNGGMLPYSPWLQTKGYKGLYYARRKNPELFAHIPQKVKIIRTPQEWLVTALDLAKKNNGVLPSPGKLQLMGYKGVYNAMRAHPELFKDIQQIPKKEAMSLEECLRVAKQLVKNNGGVLPNQKWLQTHQHTAISRAIRNHPQVFFHLTQKQPTKYRSLEEWVTLAGKLARGNKGILPPLSWLRKNKLSGLCRALWNHPELFAHIRRRTA